MNIVYDIMTIYWIQRQIKGLKQEALLDLFIVTALPWVSCYVFGLKSSEERTSSLLSLETCLISKGSLYLSQISDKIKILFFY